MIQTYGMLGILRVRRFVFHYGRSQKRYLPLLGSGDLRFKQLFWRLYWVKRFLT